MFVENLGSTANSRYTGFCKIVDRNVLDLQSIIWAGHSKSATKFITLQKASLQPMAGIS